MLLQQAAAAAAEVDPVERAGQGVEAGREDDDVALVERAAGDDALGRDAVDRRLGQIDERHVLQVVSLVVVRVGAQALGEDRVGLRHELLRDHLVLHPAADLLPHELG